MDCYTEFYWKLIPQNDPGSLEPTWTTPYLVHHMTPNVKLFLMLRDPIERLFCFDCFISYLVNSYSHVVMVNINTLSFIFKTIDGLSKNCVG